MSDVDKVNTELTEIFKCSACPVPCEVKVVHRREILPHPPKRCPWSGATPDFKKEATDGNDS